MADGARITGWWNRGIPAALRADFPSRWSRDSATGCLVRGAAKSVSKRGIPCFSPPTSGKNKIWTRAPAFPPSARVNCMRFDPMHRENAVLRLCPVKNACGNTPCTVRTGRLIPAQAIAAGLWIRRATDGTEYFVPYNPMSGEDLTFVTRRGADPRIAGETRRSSIRPRVITCGAGTAPPPSWLGVTQPSPGTPVVIFFHYIKRLSAGRWVGQAHP